MGNTVKKKKILNLTLLLFSLTIVAFFLISRFTMRNSLGNIVVEKWDGSSVATSFSGGNGSKDNPFQIKDGKELAYFKEVIEGNDNIVFTDKYYVLTNDIDLDNHNFSSIGNSTNNIFRGYFDGAGHTIINFLNNEATTIDNVNYYGLFSIVEDSNIANLNIASSSISIQNTEDSNLLNVGILAGVIKNNNSTNSINNISMQDISINLDNAKINEDNNIGGIVGSIKDNAIVNNCFIKVNWQSTTVSNVGNIVGNLDATLSNTSVYATSSSLILSGTKYYNKKTNTASVTNIYKLTYNNSFTITKEDSSTISTDILLSDLNSKINSKYEWYLDQDNFKIKEATNIQSNLRRTRITAHESGITTSTVYINDFEADYNYFMGKNYTDSSDGSLPTTINKNIYSASNLVKVAVTYNGNTINNSNEVGTVSTTEAQNKYVYYNYYEVENGYVNIELIDNPFTNRPTNKAFNGWITDYSGALVTYDKSYYSRSVKIPVTQTDGENDDIDISFYASWIDANIYNITSTGNAWSTASNALKGDGMQMINGRIPIYENMSNYYILGGTINYYRRYPSNSYNEYGENVSNNRCYNLYGGCTYYNRADSTYEEGTTYYNLDYYNGASVYTPQIIGYGDTITNLEIGSLAASYYKSVTIAYNSSIVGYYSSLGEYQSNGVCSSSGGCTYYQLIPYYDSNGNVNIVNDSDNYYYLTTRDTNIIVMRANQSTAWTSTLNKPFTLTSVYNGTDYRNSARYNVGNISLHCYNDTNIENLYFYTTTSSLTSTNSFTGSSSQSAYIYGNFHNLKIGRGIRNNGSYVSLNGFIGGTNSGGGSSSNILKYRLIVESGYYSNGASVNGGISTSSTYTEAKAIYGSDYDRVNDDNDKFIITDCIAAFWGGNSYSSSNTAKSIDAVYKSGKYGSRKGGNTSGIYYGQRQGGNANALRVAKIEGGWFYAINGGPSVASSFRNLNSATLYITGGEITMLYGGAGRDTTYGNRIIQMTGGKIDYSLFGGSNAYANTSNAGTINGSSYVYVGGNAVVGDTTLVNNNTTLFSSEAGSVFGHGNGGAGSSVVGSNDNSTVIIDGDAHINRNVYGGSNNGLAGSTTNQSTTTVTMKVLGGTIAGSVYGGGNNNGIGDTDIKANINIDIENGSINGSVYGGTRTTGTVYGDSNLNILGGTITNNVYGGGEGNNTYVAQNINVTVGDNNVTTTPTISNNVYGGSAFGTINNTIADTSVTTYTTNVTVNKGIINGSVFGGGQGSSNYTPTVSGNIRVDINGGNIGNVFGGCDAAGVPNGTVFVYLTGGIIGNAYGGGNNTSVTTTNIYLQGSTLNYLFGGSNTQGNVTTSNVYTTSGSVASVYGGNNIGGTTSTSNVLISGITSITKDVYGGGKLATTTNSFVKTYAVTLNNVYGGGESADVDVTSVKTFGTTITSLFGGSNTSGTVNNSNIEVNGNIITNVYGGNNQGGTTTTTSVNIIDGTITNTYGGGNNATSTTSNVNIYGGMTSNLFGGGNQAGLTTSNVNIYGGTIIDTYGGSNNSGNVTTSNIETKTLEETTDDVTIQATVNAVDATWQSSTYPTYATVDIVLTNNTATAINNWEASIIIADSVIYSSYSSTDVIKTGDVYTFNSINKWNGNYNSLAANGGTFTFTFAVLSNQPSGSFAYQTNVITPTPNMRAQPLSLDNIYGGNNRGGLTTTSNIDITKGIITNIFGGGNVADTDDTNVNIANATVTNVYGGGNEASINNSTNVVVDSTTILDNIYGGGNQGTVLKNTLVTLKSTAVLGSAYAGGNGVTAIVSGNTTINVAGNTVIGSTSTVSPRAGCVFGGGNAAATGSQDVNNSVATVNIVGATIYGNVYGGANTSVVYGQTNTNIGTTAVNDNTLTEGDISIVGTVFGGGEANAEGNESYDFSFICVTVAIDININGKNYDTNNHKFEISGSIFGSGNASSSSGTSNIYIANLGSYRSPSRNISIQRSDEVIIDNSYMELSGATDRTNDYSSIKYSFNRIDLLNIKNNTTLLLQHNANLLKELKSTVDVNNTSEKATVVIDDDTQEVTKNVDNRIYMLANSNLNVTTNQAGNIYGKVSGMTFFGMYNTYSNGSIDYGVYDKNFNYGSSADAGDAIIGGSYVAGLHSLNHDITIDGFYSNYLNDDYTLVTTKYIDPSPKDANYYMWTIGLTAINYNFALTASKYSSLGTYELSMRDFASGDTIFNVIGFNSLGLTSGVSLVNSNNVPKIANTAEEANSILGLSMKAETSEWTSYGTTKLLSSNDGSYIGTTSYKTDSQAKAPSLMFYLYHAKNITLDADLGTVVISLQALTPKNEIEYNVDLITITIDLNARNYSDADSYDASITYDKKYDFPSTTTVNITNKSQFTAYYSLYATTESLERFYGTNNTNYHVLTSTYALPVGTTITMIDKASDLNNPEYYYYTVDQSSYNASVTQLEQDNEVTYPLSRFIRMGSTSSGNTYNDSVANTNYYNNGRVNEEFLFIVDLKNTNITGDTLDNSLLLELRNSEDRAIISVLGIRQNLMKYNLYQTSNVVLGETITMNEYLYHNLTSNIDYTTNVGYDQTTNRDSIIDTNYEAISMGLNLYINDSSNNLLSSSVLTGTYLKIGTDKYYADSDGVFRIKLAGKVANLNKKIYLVTNSQIPPGNYKFKYVLFASNDGLHISNNLTNATVIKDVTVVGSNNAIVVDTTDKEKVVNGTTGLNLLGNNYNNYTVTYNSELTNPNLRISIMKRNIDDKDTTVYEEIDFNNLFTNNMVLPSTVGLTGNTPYEKMVTATLNTTNDIVFNLNSNLNLTSGTYRLMFKLYDNNQIIEEAYKYLIVKKDIE